MKMVPAPTPDTHETERSSAEQVSRVCQQLPRCTAKTTSVQSSTPDSSKEESLALEKTSERLQQYIDDASQPRYHRALKDMLNLNHGTKLTQCICLGLGHFNLAADKKGKLQSSSSHTSLHQLAVLIVMLRILADRHTIQETYFQDPAFTEVEKAFLKSLGYTVLEDPAACKKISSHTFLFAPFLGYPVAASALTVAFPALYIGNSPDKYLESLRHYHKHPTSEVEDIIRILVLFQNATVDGEALPSFDQQLWADKTTVHWLLPALTRDTGEI